ncbi:MAG: 4-hydroxy-tetrahydrodipicolinate synthase, partial [Candidatus Competibacteraceae bacterium]|nr:4-hydroxy-tetrahydrodipicolinate synthase [Candidatus Competibacteraceae bacterium]
MFHGSMVAMVTPMTDDGSVDFEALANLVEFHIDNNTDAIIAVGTTGESATLDPDEHCQVIRRIVEVVNKRIPVIAGTGANSTSEALHLSQAAKEVGADACLLVTPYYNKPTQEGLYQHFKTLAERIALPQILYNVPGRTSCDMLPDTVDRLANISNIVGIKESSTLNRIGELIDRCSDRMAIYSGDDPVAIDTILLGGKGVISVTANVAPHAMHAMCAAALQGDKAEAKRIDNTLKPLHKALFL